LIKIFARSNEAGGICNESPQPTFASLGVFIRFAAIPIALSLALQSIACERERNTASISVILFILL